MCEFQKMIETTLKDEESNTAIAIRLFAQMIDRRFVEYDQITQKRHKELIEAINKTNSDVTNLRSNTETKFQTLSIVTFFSKHPKIFWFLISSVIFLAGSGAGNIVSTLLK